MGDQPTTIGLTPPDDRTAQPVAASRVARRQPGEVPDEMGAGHAAVNADGQIAFFNGKTIREILDAIRHLGAHGIDTAAEGRNGVKDHGIRCVERHHAIDLLVAEGVTPFVKGGLDQGFRRHHDLLTRCGRGRIRVLQPSPS